MMQCSPNRKNDPTSPRRKSRLTVDQQQDEAPPSHTFSSSSRRTLVSRRRITGGGKVMSPPTTPLLQEENDQHMREWSALLGIPSFSYPELLVAPDDDEEALRAARRWDMLKDDMLMFYREIYKLQVKESCDPSPSSAPHSTGGPAHEDNIEEEDKQYKEEQEGDEDDEEAPPTTTTTTTSSSTTDHIHDKTWEKKLDDQRDQRSRQCS